ncbi:MAG TPA: GYD domain-containing protein [Acidimicrobiales bacterium]
MPTYILLSTLTAEGRKTLQNDPQRLNRVNDEVEAFGCTVIDQYAVLGPYDFVTLVEAPNNSTVAQLSLDLGSRGTVNILTLPAIPIDDFEAQLRNAEEVGSR